MMNILRRTLLLCIVCVASVTGRPSPGFAASIELGVGTHFAQFKGDVGMTHRWLEESGFLSIRDEMYWSHIEGDAPDLEWRAGASNTKSALQTLGPQLRPLIVLDYGNPKYDAGGLPRSAQAIAAFSRYASWVASQLRPAPAYLEIWNEWNKGSERRSTAASAADYANLVAQASPAIRGQMRDAKVLVGAAAEDLPRWNWVREVIGQGALRMADGLSVHLYNHCMGPQAGAAEMVARLDQLRTQMTTAGYGAVPIYATEVGWPTYDGKCGISEQNAARYALHFLLSASMRDWIAGIWFYELFDGGPNRFDMEQRFGLLRTDGTEKPMGCVLRSFAKLISQRPRSTVQSGSVAGALFAGDKGQLLFIWDQAQPSNRKRMILSLGGSVTGDLKLLDPCSLGSRQPVLQSDGKFEVDLDGMPVVLALPQNANGYGLAEMPAAKAK